MGWCELGAAKGLAPVLLGRSRGEQQHRALLCAHCVPAALAVPVLVLVGTGLLGKWGKAT